MRSVQELLSDPSKIEEEIQKAQKASDESQLDKGLKDRIRELQMMKGVAMTKQKIDVASGKTDRDAAAQVREAELLERNNRRMLKFDNSSSSSQKVPSDPLLSPQPSSEEPVKKSVPATYVAPPVFVIPPQRPPMPAPAPLALAPTLALGTGSSSISEGVPPPLFRPPPPPPPFRSLQMGLPQPLLLPEQPPVADASIGDAEITDASVENSDGPGSNPISEDQTSLRGSLMEVPAALPSTFSLSDFDALRRGSARSLVGASTRPRASPRPTRPHARASPATRARDRRSRRGTACRRPLPRTRRVRQRWHR